MGYGSSSFFCVLVPHGMNDIVFGKEDGEGGQKVVTYSDTISAMLSC